MNYVEMMKKEVKSKKRQEKDFCYHEYPGLYFFTMNFHHICKTNNYKHPSPHSLMGL